MHALFEVIWRSYSKRQRMRARLVPAVRQTNKISKCLWSLGKMHQTCTHYLYRSDIIAAQGPVQNVVLPACRSWCKPSKEPTASDQHFALITFATRLSEQERLRLVPDNSQVTCQSNKCAVSSSTPSHSSSSCFLPALLAQTVSSRNVGSPPWNSTSSSSFSSSCSFIA